MIDTPGATRGRRIFLAVSAAVVIALLIAARQVLLPFVLALVAAYVLMPAVRRVEQRGVPRWGAILIVYAVTLGVASGFVSLIVPRLVAEGQGLAAEWPRQKRALREHWLPLLDARLSAWSGQKPAPEEIPPENAPDDRPPPIVIAPQPDGSFAVQISEDLRIHEKRDGVWQIEQVEKSRRITAAAMLSEGVDKATTYLKENSVEVLKIGREVVFAITRSIFTLFMTLMLAAYMMLTSERIFGFFRTLVSPTSRESFDRFLRRLQGQAVIGCDGVLSAVGFWIFKLKYWPILSVVAAVMSLIPIFGSILSSIPAVLIGLTQSPATAAGVLAWIVGIHQLEANFLNPKIIGDSAKIHPVLVVFALIAGEHFFQLTGALFAVPCLSIAQTIFLHFREVTMGVPDPMATIPPIPPNASSARVSLKAPLAPRLEELPPPPEPASERPPRA